MQQKRQGIQQEKRGGGQPIAAQPRDKATRDKNAPGVRATLPQEHSSTKPAPQQGQRQASYVKETSTSPAMEFHPCELTGPDGHRRPGWELWVGNMMFGRADSKESLLAYHSRLYEPIPSGHWKDRAWQPVKKKSTGRPKTEERDARFDDNEVVDVEETPRDSSWVG
jgi:hypothetical protein